MRGKANISPFYFPSAEAFSIIFGGERGIRTKMISLTTHPSRRYYCKRLRWQRPASIYVYTFTCQIFEISFVKEVKFTYSIQLLTAVIGTIRHQTNV